MNGLNWKDFADYGVLFLCLAALAWAVWTSVRAVWGWWKETMKPIADAHLKLIGTIQTNEISKVISEERHAKAMEQQAESLKQLVQSNHEQHLMLLKINAVGEQTLKATEQVAKVESDCVKGIAEAGTELKKQTAELKVQTADLTEHRATLERILAEKLAGNAKGGRP